MPGLPATGELSYNGYEFDGASKIVVNVEFLLDDAQRVVIAHFHTIRVRAVLANDTDLDGDMENIRERLGEAGKELKFVNKGFGDDLTVKSGTTSAGSGGRAVDVTKGPFPKILSWEPLGDDRAAEIEWEVTVTVPVCVGGRPSYQGVMALNYGADYQINKHGDTTRTLAGYIQIAQKSGRAAQDSADRYRESFSPAPLHGFTRQQTWSLSLDKARIDFVITDTQVPTTNPYPQGVTDITASHSESWRQANNSARYFNTITANITLEPGLSGDRAWQVFRDLVNQRMSLSKAKGKPPFLISLNVEESIFSRTHNFSATYRILSSISDFIGDSGMWRPIGTNWTAWITSLGQSVFNKEARGAARLKDIPQNDIVVSLCPKGPTIHPNNLQEFRVRKFTSPGMKNERPPREKSYYEFESWIEPVRHYSTVRQAIIQSPGDTKSNWPLDQPPDTPPDDFNFGDKGGVPDVIQEGGRGRYGVALKGRAKRAGYPIARPSLLKFGDQTVHEQAARFMQRIIGDFFGIPVYEAMWDVNYIVTGSPGFVSNLEPEGEDFDF